METWERGDRRAAPRNVRLAAIVSLLVGIAAVAAIYASARDTPLTVDRDVVPTTTETDGPPPAHPAADEDVALLPVQTPSRTDCRRVADEVGFAVPCPSGLPPPGSATSCEGGVCIETLRDAGRGAAVALSVGVVIQQKDFQPPAAPPWSGVPRDLVVTAVPIERRSGGELQLAGPPELVGCFPERTPQPRGRRTFRTCVDAQPWIPGAGGYPLERHTAAVWRRGNVVYAAGVEGAGEHIETLLSALINSIVYVEPS